MRSNSSSKKAPRKPVAPVTRNADASLKRVALTGPFGEISGGSIESSASEALDSIVGPLCCKYAANSPMVGYS